MTTAEKLTAVAENQQMVYDAGYAKGKAEGIDYDTFWDVLQDNGNRVNYQYAFAHDRFSDATYNPKYPITTKSGTTPSRYTFFQNTLITDTKVPIYANGNDVNYAFQGCTGLVTIRELHVNESQAYTSTFASCSSLKNITIVGTIGNSIDLSACPLERDSILSVYNALSTSVTGQTVTFKKTAINAAFGSTASVEWKALTDAKPNWSYAYK